jgi:hypothetical protein
MMGKKFVKAMCAVLAIALAVAVGAGCKKKLPAPANVDAAYEWLKDKYTDSSQLNSWDQEIKLDLVAWNTNQTGGFKRYESSNDVVSSEIERITGISIDTDKLIDNAGKTADVRFGDLLTIGLPDIAYGNSWIDPEEVYDLTDLIDKYCPTIKARMPKTVWNATNINGGQKGKVFAVPYGLGNVSLSEVDPKTDRNKSLMFQFIHDNYPYVLVREDILKDAYPEAKTKAEIRAIYNEKGYFSEEELFDVEIESAEQFRTEFLPNIYKAIHADQKYKINGERWIMPMLAGDGSDRDTWSFLGILLPWLLGATASYSNTMFSYWDALDQECKVMVAQDFYKEELAEWAELIKNGTYINQFGLRESNATVQSELNNGYYVIAYMYNCRPNGDIATYKGEQVNYRRVYMKIPQNERFEYLVNAVPAPAGVSIFKDKVREDDLPQILRWLDFQASELGDKLFAWGPQSAGLFEEREVDGKTIRQYKNEALVDQMVYSTATLGTEVQKYNLSNASIESAQPVFPFFIYGGSKDHPKCVYDLSRINSLVDLAFCSGAVVEQQKIKIARTAGLDSWSENELEGITKLWSRRATVETALKEVIVSGDNFEAKYAAMKNQLNSVGWTESYFTGVFTEKFLNLNVDWLENFYKG